MKLISLNSSSSGNMHILENGRSTILLDCGIRYDSYVHENLKGKKIDGVLLTHEHGDHISGCKGLSENKRTYFYSTRETLSCVDVPEFMKQPQIPFKQFYVGTFSIISFEVKHDAVHPVNFLIRDEISGSKLLYITDTGYIDNLEFHDIDYILIECNFDEKWYEELNVEDVEVNPFIKPRLLSEKGHLSIQKVFEFLKRTINCNTKKIILCHIHSSYTNFEKFATELKEKLDFENIVSLDPQIRRRRVACINFLNDKKEIVEFE